MRVPSRCIPSAVSVTLLLALLAANPTMVSAQCGMMGGGGGGHDHGATQADRASKPSASERKLRQGIDRVLSDDRGRAMLVEALLNDRAFMDTLIQRLAAIPEWRAMAARQIGSPQPAGEDGRGASGAVAIVYACPMHPEVTASGPGDCPKCGMALVRKDARGE